MFIQTRIQHWNRILNECFIGESYKGIGSSMHSSILKRMKQDRTNIVPVLYFDVGMHLDRTGLEYDTPSKRELQTFYNVNPYFRDTEFMKACKVIRAYCTGLSDDGQHATLWQPGHEEFAYARLPQTIIWGRIASDVEPDPHAADEHLAEKFDASGVDIARDDEGVEKFIASYCEGTELSPLDVAERLYSLDSASKRIQDNIAQTEPDFYAAWLYPSKKSCDDEDERIRRIRSATAHSPEEILQWIADNKLAGDIVIEPVKYSYIDGRYQPEDGKDTIDTIVGSIAPYKQIPKIRVKPMSAAERKRLERLITDPLYRQQQRARDLAYSRSGRREQLKKEKTPEQIQQSRRNSKRRAALIQAVCKQFFPEIYDAWKNGKTQLERDQARAELVKRLDFATGDGLPEKALAVWRDLYDRFSVERKAALEEINAAYKEHDEKKTRRAVEKYNAICRKYADEAASKDNVTQLIALDSKAFTPKSI